MKNSKRRPKLGKTHFPQKSLHFACDLAACINKKEALSELTRKYYANLSMTTKTRYRDALRYFARAKTFRFQKRDMQNGLIERMIRNDLSPIRKFVILIFLFGTIFSVLSVNVVLKFDFCIVNIT